MAGAVASIDGGFGGPLDDQKNSLLSGGNGAPHASKVNTIELISGAISKTNVKKRQEQLQRWELSETNKYPDTRKIQDSAESKAGVGMTVVKVVHFMPGVKFLAACSAKDLNEVERLLRAGTDINSANIDGLTALHQACIDNSFEVFKYLIDNGADVNARDSEGWTALHAAASCGFLEMTKYLISHGARLDMVNNDGDLAVDLAEDMDIKNLISAEMITKGIDCDAARRQEEDMMMEDAKSWLAMGKYEEEPDPLTGATSLHVAAAKGYDNVIRVLLDAGADINAQDIDGWTPLHAAAHWAQKEAAKILSERLADFEITTRLGETVMDLADEEMDEYLRELQKAQEKIQQDIEKKDTAKSSMMRNLFKDKRRSSITRLSLEQRQSMLSKNTEEERQKLEAMRQSLVIEDVEEEGAKEAQAGGGNGKLVGGGGNGKLIISDTANNIEAMDNILRNKASTALPTVPESPSIHESSSASLVSSDLKPTASVRQSVTDTSVKQSATDTPTIVRQSVTDTLANVKQSVADTQANVRQSVTDTPGNARQSVTGTSVSGYSSRFDTRRTSQTESISKPVEVASLTARSSQAAEVAASPRRLDLRNIGSVSSTLGEDLTSVEPPASRSEVSTTVAESANNNRPVSTKIESVSTGSRATEVNTEESLPARSKAPLLSSATAAALAAIANQRRSIELPKRDEAKEVERRLRARKARESRRSTQGVTKEDMESAEQALQAAAAASGSAASRADSMDTASTVSISSVDSSSSGTSSSASLSSHASSAAAELDVKRDTAVADDTAAARLSGRWPWTEQRRESDSAAEIRRSQIPGVTIGSPSSLARRELRNSVPAASSLDRSTTAALDVTTARPALSVVGRANISSYRSKYLQEKETKQQPDVVQVRESLSVPAKTASEMKPHPKSDACPCADCEDANQTSTIAAAIRAKKKRESRRPTGRISFDAVNTSEDSNADDSSREQSVDVETKGKEDVVGIEQQAVPQKPLRPASASLASSSSCESTIDYKKLYELQHSSNQRLRDDIQELKQELTNCRNELALARTSTGMAGTTELNFDQKDKRTMERRVSELEEELKIMETLKLDNQRLKEENAALIRVISKLSK